MLTYKDHTFSFILQLAIQGWQAFRENGHFYTLDRANPMWDMNQSNKNRSRGFSHKENSFPTIREGWFLWEASKTLLSDFEGCILIAGQFNRNPSDKNATPFRLYFWNLLALLNKRRHEMLLLEPLLKTELWIEFNMPRVHLVSSWTKVAFCIQEMEGSLRPFLDIVEICPGVFFLQSKVPPRFTSGLGNVKGFKGERAKSLYQRRPPKFTRVNFAITQVPSFPPHFYNKLSECSTNSFMYPSNLLVIESSKLYYVIGSMWYKVHLFALLCHKEPLITYCGPVLGTGHMAGSKKRHVLKELAVSWRAAYRGVKW